MITIYNKELLNEFDLIVVHDRLTKMGINHAEIRPGNDCIWVSTGSSSRPINSYWIFRNGQLITVEYD